MQVSTRKPHACEISDEQWRFAAPYLLLMEESAPYREHGIREVYNACAPAPPRRNIPHDLPLWAAVYQQAHRVSVAGVFEARAHELPVLLRSGTPSDRALSPGIGWAVPR